VSRRRRWGRRLAVGVAAVAIAAMLAIAWKPSRVALQALVMLPSLVDAGPQPLRWFSAAPRRETMSYRSDPSAAGDLADLWLPAGASSRDRVGGMVLVLGVNNVGRDYPAVTRFGETMARSGIAVLIPDSAGLLAGQLAASEVGGVVDAFRFLASRPEVDPGRIGLVGLSVGGALTLLAAGDPAIADRVRWVNTFGSYASAREYLAEVAAHAFDDSATGRTVAWQPALLAREVLFDLLLSRVGDATDVVRLHDALDGFMADGRLPSTDPVVSAALRSPAAAIAYRLLTAGSLPAAREVIDELPAELRSLLDELSPGLHLDRIHADVFLMHDTGDAYVPYVESRTLAGDLRQVGRLRRATELRLFDHVEPKGVDLIAAAPELWTLLWHVQAVLMETL
jgi:hypothetical protein